MEKLPPLGFVPLLLSRYLKKAAAGSSASHQPRTTSSDHSTDEGNTHVTHRHHDSSGSIRSPQAYPEALVGTSGDPQIPDPIAAAATYGRSVPSAVIQFQHPRASG